MTNKNLKNNVKNKPKIYLLSTGGTISSYFDKETRRLDLKLSAIDLLKLIPNIEKIADIETQTIFNLYSENITPAHWEKLAELVYRKINSKISGIIITHGTDTMAYTASALSFAIQKLPIPIILVGSMKPPTTANSDAPINLHAAIIAAIKSDFAEVVVAMLENQNKKSVAIHRGVRVRKCHTSRKDAFKSINYPPIARIINNEIQMLTSEYVRRNPSRKPKLLNKFERRVSLIKFYPGFDPIVIDWFIDNGYKGLIIEGVGLGHIGSYCFNAIKRAIDNNLVVAMTSQCIWGKVNMNIYNSGRKLIEIGVIPLKDMLPETALVKLMWIFGSLTKDPDEAKRLMLKNFVGEIKTN